MFVQETFAKKCGFLSKIDLFPYLTDLFLNRAELKIIFIFNSARFICKVSILYSRMSKKTYLLAAM